MKAIMILTLATLFISCNTLEGLFEQISNNIGGQSSNSSNSNTSQSTSSSSTSRNTITLPVPRRSYKIPVSYERAYLYRTDAPDPKMTKIPQNIEAYRVNTPDEYIKQIVSYINEGAKDDFDRVKKAHDLVAVLIRYDAANFWANSVPDQSYQNVLKTRLAVCEGYANLFKRLCDELKITCEKVTGFARGVGTSPLVGDTPNVSNHAWNIVTIESESYLIDCTWDSGFMDGRVAKQQYTTDRLFLKPEHFIYTHFPQNSSYQLLSTSLTVAQFCLLPFFSPKFFELASELSINLQKINQINNMLSFEYTIKDGYRFSFRLNDINNGREIQNSTFVQRDGNTETVFFSFPVAGQYSVNIFWWKTNSRQGQSCGEFIVETSSSSNVQYPTTYSSSARNLLLISPIEMPLEKGKIYNFQIRVDNKNNVAILYGRTFVQLTKDANGIFSLEFEIPSNINSLSVGIADSERGRYENILQYQVK